MAENEKRAKGGSRAPPSSPPAPPGAPGLPGRPAAQEQAQNRPINNGRGYAATRCAIMRARVGGAPFTMPYSVVLCYTALRYTALDYTPLYHIATILYYTIL